MTDRDRLIELFSPFADGTYNGSGTIVDGTKVDDVVDSLLANGVIAPPCKVGDTYYTIEKYCNTDPYATEKEKVSTSDCEYWCNGEHCSFKEYRIEEHKWDSIITILKKEEWFGKHYFLTKEEAEEKLKELGK